MMLNTKFCNRSL